MIPIKHELTKGVFFKNSEERRLHDRILIIHHIVLRPASVPPSTKPVAAMASIGSFARFVSRRAVAKSLTPLHLGCCSGGVRSLDLYKSSRYPSSSSCISTSSTSFKSRNQARRTFAASTSRTMSHSLYDSDTPPEVKEAKVPMLNSYNHYLG